MSITEEHLRIFDKYDSNPDFFARGATKDEKKFFDEILFQEIDELVNNRYLIRNNLVSNDFSQKLKSDIENHVENKDLIKQLDFLAVKYYEKV